MKKVICILLMLTLLIGLMLPLTSCIDMGNYTEWQTTEDGAITNGTRIYSYYGEVAHRTRMDSFNVFSYYNDVYIDGEEYWIYSAKSECEVIYVCRAWSMDNTEYAYATDSGKKILDEFFAGESDTIRLISGIDTDNDLSAADITKALHGELVSMSGNTLSVSVTELADEKRYDIIYFDDEGYLTNCHGAIYVIDEKYYFIDYYKLDNSYFDSDGFFSYRQGTVTLTEAGKDISEGLDEVLSRAYSYEYSFVYESPIYEDPTPPTDTEVYTRFIITAVLFGIVLPLVPMGFCIFDFCKKKKRTSIPTYIAAAASLIWIIAGITLLIII